MSMVLWLILAFAAGMGLGVIAARVRRIKMVGGRIMYVVKADNPDVGYSIVPPQVTDSEGNAVPVGDLTFEIESDNPAAVEVLPTGPLAGTVHFGGPNADGTPATAAITVRVIYNGTTLGMLGAQFTVTAGDPAAIVGGSLVFEGLVEV